MSINTLKSFIVNHSKQGKQGNFCLWRLQNVKIDRFCRFWRKSFRKLGQSDSNLCSSWKHISIENIHKFESLIFIWYIIFSSEVVPWNNYLLLKNWSFFGCDVPQKLFLNDSKYQLSYFLLSVWETRQDQCLYSKELRLFPTTCTLYPYSNIKNVEQWIGLRLCRSHPRWWWCCYHSKFSDPTSLLEIF